MDDVVNQVIDGFASTGPRKDRTAIFVELTKSICPICKKNVDAQVYLEDNKLFMEKRCSEHGKFKALLQSDAQWYFDSLKFNKPGSIPLHFNSKSAGDARRTAASVPITSSTPAWVSSRSPSGAIFAVISVSPAAMRMAQTSRWRRQQSGSTTL